MRLITITAQHPLITLLSFYTLYCFIMEFISLGSSHSTAWNSLRLVSCL